MKSSFYISPAAWKMNCRPSLIIIGLIWQLTFSGLAQTIEPESHQLDHLFPQKGKSLVTFATGIPYVGIAEYAYGFSDRFSIGVLAGATTVIPGIGIRVRGVLYQNDNQVRIYARIPILYYPQTKGLGGEPWMLTWPVINYEKTFDSGLRWSFGGGMVAAACVNDLFDIVGAGKHKHATIEDHQHGHHDVIEEEGFMGDIWNTVQTGIAVPISKKWMFQTELAAVLKGLSIADDGWVGGPPVILTIGFTGSF